MRTTLFMVICLNLLAGCSARQPTIASDPQVRTLALTDINGRAHRPLDASSAAQIASVLVFITVDCPIANGYAPELSSIVREYSGSGVRFFFVHVDQSVRLDQARQHALDHGLNAPVLIDSQHELVKAVGATRTPEVAVIDRNGELAYRGRIDDRYVDLGKKRVHPSQRDLREALDAILAGRPVGIARTKAVGCFIPESS